VFLVYDARFALIVPVVVISPPTTPSVVDIFVTPLDLTYPALA
jgi:hypothetical protein